MLDTTPAPRRLTDDKDTGPIDYPRTCDLENETPRPGQWRSYLIRLLCWWPDEDE
jgi:hypothetical protein